MHPAIAATKGSRKDKIAHAVVAFVGTWAFLALHVAWFSSWIAFGVEKFPYGFLTMLVSLEAIFLSVFVLISQNREEEQQEAVAAVDHENLALNTKLTKEVHQMVEQIAVLDEKLNRLLGG